MAMENLARTIQGLKMNGNLINRLVIGWDEKIELIAVYRNSNLSFVP
ncbi:hypothetical protein AN389_02013 [Pseudoalteromonas sp. P1-7a]|nr:hypothetical protein AN389_02013 [Pseudoalteromonas sp. P1-7a]